jgi:ATP phosphoribosyltransferase
MFEEKSAPIKTQSKTRIVHAIITKLEVNTGERKTKNVMTNIKNEIMDDIKKIHPNLSDDEVLELFESIKTYCEIVIDHVQDSEKDN